MTLMSIPVRSIAKTNVQITQLGMGGATLGDLWQRTPDSQALATIDAAYDAGVRFFDTAPWYGLGKSELRMGCGLRDRPDAVVATKVGRILHRGGRPENASRWVGGLPFGLTFDYTRSGVIRSFEDSLQRLGMTRVDALAIHDLDMRYHENPEGVDARFRELDTGGGYAALREIVASGGVSAIGAGINRTGLIPKFLAAFDLDYFLVAMPYTLLSQEGLAELNQCAERGVSVIIGSPYASGLLASGATRPASYDYGDAPAAMVEKTRRLESVCARHAVPLAAAALQFVLAHPAVVSVIPGPASPEQARQNAEYYATPVPAAFWRELLAEKIIDPLSPVPR